MAVEDEMISLKRREWEELLRDNERMIQRYEALLKDFARLEEENKRLREELQAAEDELRRLRGALREGPPPKSPVIVKKQPHAVLFCIYCGRRLVPNAAYCDICGWRVERGPASFLERLKSELTALIRRTP